MTADLNVAAESQPDASESLRGQEHALALAIRADWRRRRCLPASSWSWLCHIPVDWAAGDGGVGSPCAVLPQNPFHLVPGSRGGGLSPRTISDPERGIHRTARKDTAVLLADALGLAGPVGGLFVAAARGRARLRTWPRPEAASCWGLCGIGGPGPCRVISPLSPAAGPNSISWQGR
jgi:hypothetical protein